MNAARALKADLREQLATGSVSDTSDATAQSLGGEQDGRGGMRWGEMRWGGMDWRVAKPQPVFGAAPCHCRLARRRLDRGALPPPVCMLEEGTRRADHERDSLGEAVAGRPPANMAQAPHHAIAERNWWHDATRTRRPHIMTRIRHRSRDAAATLPRVAFRTIATMYPPAKHHPPHPQHRRRNTSDDQITRQSMWARRPVPTNIHLE